MSDSPAAYSYGWMSALEAVTHALNACPALDANGYITEKKYVLQAIKRLEGNMYHFVAQRVRVRDIDEISGQLLVEFEDGSGGWHRGRVVPARAV